MSINPYPKRKRIIAVIIVWLWMAFVLPAAAQDLTELEEAAQFLKNTGENLKAFTVYKLPDTDGSEVVPQIADKIIKNGKDFERLQKIAVKVMVHHGLSNHCSVILFKDENPIVLTYKLRSISFSTKVLEILSDDEILALTAHEIGHLYFAKDLADARTSDNARLARITELKCDIIALITLKQLEKDPMVLISALKKLIQEREKARLETSTTHSPSIKDRADLAEIFLQQLMNKK
jgi:hypothetical protein